MAAWKLCGPHRLCRLAIASPLFVMAPRRLPDPRPEASGCPCLTQSGGWGPPRNTLMS